MGYVRVVRRKTLKMNARSNLNDSHVLNHSIRIIYMHCYAIFTAQVLRIQHTQRRDVGIPDKRDGCGAIAY